MAIFKINVKRFVSEIFIKKKKIPCCKHSFPYFCDCLCKQKHITILISITHNLILSNKCFSYFLYTVWPACTTQGWKQNKQKLCKWLWCVLLSHALTGGWWGWHLTPPLILRLPSHSYSFLSWAQKLQIDCLCAHK